LIRELFRVFKRFGIAKSTEKMNVLYPGGELKTKKISKIQQK
jgi:hypothetical protein